MENPSRSKYMITGVSFTLLAMVLVAGGTDDPIIMTGAILLSIFILIFINYEYIKLFNYAESLQDDGQDQ
jgi:hypothetical protein